MCTNLKPLNVNSRSPHGVKFSYVPCGTCSECRKQYQNDWAFRLSAELDCLKKQGWFIGFCTLTYKNSKLPHVPKEAFYKESRYRRIACFSRKHVRTFIDNLRKYLWKDYGLTGLRYFVGAEFGEHTKRPHYHMLICWNPLSNVAGYPMITPFVMHRKILHCWQNGFVFPFKCEGGKDSKGYVHKPFEVSASAFDASHYASKYACKDLAFQETLVGVCQKSEYFKDCKCFHLQSKSLGSFLLENSTDEMKLKLLKDGISFQSEEKMQKIPRYLKNKILFTQKYSYITLHGEKVEKIGKEYVNRTTGEVFKYAKRIVERCPTGFFKRNYKKIYQKKVEYYQEFISQLLDLTYMESLDIEHKRKYDLYDDLRKDILNYSVKFCGRNESLGEDIVRFSGVYGENCYKSNYPALTWFNRFLSTHEFRTLERIDFERYCSVNVIYSKICRFLSFRSDDIKIQEKERYLNKVNDYIRGCA